ncbi:unnamed protein product [Ectocarpus sp. 12 AP-2014]
MKAASTVCLCVFERWHVVVRHASSSSSSIIHLHIEHHQTRHQPSPTYMYIHKHTRAGMDKIVRTAAWLFGPPTPERQQKEERSRQRQEERLASTPLFKDTKTTTTPTTAPCGDTPGTPVKQKKRESKRTWSEALPVQSVHQTVLGDRKKFPRGQCCALQCTERFNTGNGAGAGAAVIGFSYNGEFLRREQEEFRQFGTEPARKAWVMKHVPVARLSKGSMMAAGSPVCSFAFMKIFGVTSTLVSSCKGTPKARASPFATSAHRCLRREERW